MIRSLAVCILWCWLTAVGSPAVAESHQGQAFYLEATVAHRDGNPTRAALYYALAAKEGHLKAQYRLGEFYETGFGLEQDLVQARRWYGEAAGRGFGLAAERLAALALGKTVSQVSSPDSDPDVSLSDNLPNSTDLGTGGSEVRQDIRSAFVDARQSLSAGNPADAIDPLRYVARQGNAEAQYLLADLLISGRAGIKNLEEAMGWLQRSAAQDYIPAIRDLGRHDLDDENPSRNIQRGLDRLRRAADADDAEAQEIMAILSFIGFGLERSVPRAFDWAERAIDGGWMRAYRTIGLFHLALLSNVDRRDRALEWFRKGAEAGDPMAQTALGVMLINGSGLNRPAGQKINNLAFSSSDQEARKSGLLWLKRAADKGDVDALRNLGHYYAGVGTGHQDFTEARRWYVLAAERGDAEAQAGLGYLYEAGLGVPQDDGLALRWFLVAAGAGHGEAMARAAWIMATRYSSRLRDPKLALAFATKAVRQRDTTARLSALSAAYAAVGSFLQATRHQDRALSLAHRSGSATSDLAALGAIFRARQVISCAGEDCLIFPIPSPVLGFPQKLPY